MKTYHFNLEITKKCNQKCFYCFNDSGYSKKRDEFSLAEWKNLITGITLKGNESVHITGGEPFLHPDIMEILSHSINLGLKTSILSNGLNISRLAQSFPELFSKLVVAQISLDSMNPELHNKRRGYANSFSDAMSAIAALINLNVPVEVSSTVSDENINDLYEIGNFCKENNLGLIVRPLLTAGRAVGVLLSDNFINKISNTVKDLKDMNIQVTEDRFQYVEAENKSSNIWDNEILTVHKDGVVRGSTTSILNYF